VSPTSQTGGHREEHALGVDSTMVEEEQVDSIVVVVVVVVVVAVVAVSITLAVIAIAVVVVVVVVGIVDIVQVGTCTGFAQPPVLHLGRYHVPIVHASMGGVVVHRGMSRAQGMWPVVSARLGVGVGIGWHTGCHMGSW
jgi:hypothetical protein